MGDGVGSAVGCFEGGGVGSEVGCFEGGGVGSSVGSEVGCFVVVLVVVVEVCSFVNRSQE